MAERKKNEGADKALRSLYSYRAYRRGLFCQVHFFRPRVLQSSHAHQNNEQPNPAPSSNMQKNGQNTESGRANITKIKVSKTVWGKENQGEASENTRSCRKYILKTQNGTYQRAKSIRLDAKPGESKTLFTGRLSSPIYHRRTALMKAVNLAGKRKAQGSTWKTMLLRRDHPKRSTYIKSQTRRQPSVRVEKKLESRGRTATAKLVSPRRPPPQRMRP